MSTPEQKRSRPNKPKEDLKKETKKTEATTDKKEDEKKKESKDDKQTNNVDDKIISKDEPVNTEEDKKKDQKEDDKKEVDTRTKLEKSWDRINEPESFWMRIEMGLKREQDPKHFVHHAMLGLQDAIEGRMTEKQMKCFIKEGLSNAVYGIMIRADMPPKTKSECSDFLIAAIKWTLKNYEQLRIPEFGNILFRIFNPGQNFYEKLSKEEISPEVKQDYLKDFEAPGAQPFAIMPKSIRNFSNFILIHINCFGKLGGYDVILELLRKPAKYSGIKTILKPIRESIKFLHPDFLNVYVPKLRDLVFTRLLEAVGEPMSPDKKRCWGDVRDELKKIMSEVWPEETIHEMLLLFQLDLGFSSFQIENLQQRIFGLQKFKEVIKKTRKPKGKQFDLGKNIMQFVAAQPRPEEKEKEKDLFIEPEKVVAWFKQRGVIDYYFKVLNTHVEILRQGMDLLKFLALNNELTMAHLEQVWDGSLGIHEYDKRIIYSSLIDLSQVIEPQLVENLFERISKTPIKEYDQYLLDLVLNFTRITIKAHAETDKNQPKKYTGLEFFWQFIAEDHELGEKAVQFLSGLLTGSDCLSQRQPFVEKCIQIVNKTQALILLKNILDSQPRGKKKEKFILKNWTKNTIYWPYFSNLSLHIRQKQPAKQRRTGK